MSDILAFPDRSVGFVPQRLAEARLALQMSRAELARELNLTGQAIGYYESGARRPDMSVLLDAAKVLKQPVSFFLREPTYVERYGGTRFFRSVGTRSNKVNAALDVKLKWLWEIVNLFSSELKLPPLRMIDVPAPSRDDVYSLEEIESIAMDLRRAWGLSEGPIANMAALLETNGFLVSRFHAGSQEIDAFSCWMGHMPFVLLASDKQVAVRSRFDAAHELGHLILHSEISQEDIEDRSTLKRIEAEANLFAGAFLMPRSSVINEVYSMRLSHLQGLKRRWKVSMQAIAHRAKTVGIIDEYQYILFRKQVSARGWMRYEPLDDIIEIEEPKLLHKTWKKFADIKRLNESTIPEGIGFTLDSVAELFGQSVSEFSERSKLDSNRIETGK